MAKLIIILVIVFAIVNIQTVLTAPSHHLKKFDEREVSQKLIEFLEERQFETNFDVVNSRHKRQAGSSSTARPSSTNSPNTEVEDVDYESPSGGSDSGFFDRAIKFVMEVMQRLIKWVTQS